MPLGAFGFGGQGIRDQRQSVAQNGRSGHPSHHPLDRSEQVRTSHVGASRSTSPPVNSINSGATRNSHNARA